MIHLRYLLIQGFEEVARRITTGSVSWGINDLCAVGTRVEVDVAFWVVQRYMWKCWHAKLLFAVVSITPFPSIIKLDSHPHPYHSSHTNLTIPHVACSGRCSPMDLYPVWRGKTRAANHSRPFGQLGSSHRSEQRLTQLMTMSNIKYSSSSANFEPSNGTSTSSGLPPSNLLI